jgi:hypothetical protein
MKFETISLSNFSKNLGNLHIELDSNVLNELLSCASNDTKPHTNQNFIKKLGMQLTKNTNACLTIYGWEKGKRTIPLEKLSTIVELSNKDWSSVENSIISIKASRNGGGKIKPNFPIVIDAKLGSITGHILGDGSIDKKYQQPFFSNSNKEILKEIQINMQEIFGAQPRIWMQKPPNYGNTQWDKRLDSIDELIEGRNCGLFYPSVCGQILNELFSDFAIGKNKKITDKIRTANKSFKAGLIRAFYDDESNVNKSSRSIRLFQDKKEILTAFYQSLEKDFNISPSPIKNYVKNNKIRYYFDIHKKSNFIKFRKEIGFTSLKKLKLLDELCIIKNSKNSK